jgi:hypothetical protein
MIALGFFTYTATSAKPLLFEVSMLLTHASLAPPSSDLPQYLPWRTLTFAFTFAIGEGAGVTLGAEAAVDPKATVAVAVAIEGLVGHPAGSLMYTYINGL